MLRYLKRLIRIVSGPPKVVFGSKGENTTICDDCIFGNAQNIHIGNNVYIGERTAIYAQGGCTIKDGAIIADRVDIRTANHHYDGDDLGAIPFDEIVYQQPVVIGENCWIASHVIILPGVTVGEGAVVAAGAVVTKDVPPLAVVGGNPAKVIKYRDAGIYNKLKAEGKQYLACKKTAKLVKNSRALRDRNKQH